MLNHASDQIFELMNKIISPVTCDQAMLLASSIRIYYKKQASSARLKNQCSNLYNSIRTSNHTIYKTFVSNSTSKLLEFFLIVSQKQAQWERDHEQYHLKTVKLGFTHSRVAKISLIGPELDINNVCLKYTFEGNEANEWKTYLSLVFKPLNAYLKPLI